ncbi:MAG TPA: hypothetical protein VIK57_23670 [Streptosporangiaceae bacterium]
MAPDWLPGVHDLAEHFVTGRVGQGREHFMRRPAGHLLIACEPELVAGKIDHQIRAGDIGHRGRKE